jgi:site-specific DNA recombinase
VAFEQATQRRANCNPNATPPRVVSSPAPLVGLFRCGHCGAGMTQASGKSGRYRYYKCTTRFNKNVDACTARNLPREHTDRMMLAALSERVFTPKRVSIMLNELLRHQQQAKTAKDARLITLKKELDRATAGLDRLYQAVEEGALSIDETLRTRTQKLKARRSEVLTEMAKLRDRNALAVRRVNADTVNAFCTALKERFADRTSGLGKAYLRLLVDEIKLDGNELIVSGSHRRLADAIGLMQKRKLGAAPSFANDWRRSCCSEIVCFGIAPAACVRPTARHIIALATLPSLRNELQWLSSKWPDRRMRDCLRPASPPPLPRRESAAARACLNSSQACPV